MMMMPRLRAAVAGTASRMKQAILGSRPALELPPFPTCAAEPIAPPSLDSSPLYPRRLLLTTGIHFYRTWFVGDGTGDVEKQLFELKTRLTLLGTYKYTTLCTAEQIMNHPLLDLKSLPLLNNLVVTEYINKYMCVLRTVETSDCYFQFLISLVMGDYVELSTSPEELTGILRKQGVFPDLDRSSWAHAVVTYVDLCKKYCPSKSEDSKNELLKKLEEDRCDEMFQFYKMQLHRTIFKASFPRTNEGSVYPLTG